MNKQVMLFLFMSLLIGCTQTREKPTLEKGITIVTGKVSNFQGDKITIRLSALGAVENIEKTVIIDSLGNFNAEIELYHPQDVHLFYKKGHVRLFLYQADSIHLEIGDTAFSNKRFPAFGISGNGKSVRFSESIRDYLLYAGERSFNTDPGGKTIEEYLTLLKQEISLQDSLLQIYCKENNEGPEFKEWRQRDIRYNVANYLIDYRFVNRDYSGNLFDKSLFPADDDAAISSSLYNLHLKHYALNLGMWRDSVTLNYLAEDNYALAYGRCLDKIISIEKEGLSRDVMCYQVLKLLYNESPEDIATFLEDIDIYIETPIIKDVLLTKKTEFEKQTAQDITYLDPITKEAKENTGDFWRNLKEKYSGKVIYVDIWATWCAPCRAEIPHAIELHEHYEGKDIAFVNLCLASKVEEWQKMIKGYNIKGDNYYFNDSQSQILLNNLEFEGYPTYMIIDKDGTLINKSAPRPSSKEVIRKRLDKLII